MVIYILNLLEFDRLTLSLHSTLFALVVYLDYIGQFSKP